MSLIADSLKKAQKTKEASGTTPPAFNLLRGQNVFKDSKMASLRKYLLPVVALSVSVAYLFYSGALNKFGATLSRLPISKALDILKPEENISPSPEPALAPPPQPEAKSPAATVPQGTEVKSFGLPQEQAEPLREATVAEPVVSPPAREETPSPSEITIKRSPRKMVAQMPVKKKVAPPKTFAKPEKEKQHVVLLTPPPQSRSARFRDSTPDILKDSNYYLNRGAVHPPEIFKDSNYYFNRGIFYQQAGEIEDALIQYNKASELDPTNPEIYNNLGLIYKERKFYDTAIEQFMRALFIDPNFAKAYNNIGVVYFEKGNIKMAVINYKKAIQINPKNLEAYNNLGVVYKNQSQWKNAELVFNKAYSLNSKYPSTNYNLALLYEEMHQKSTAVFFYRRFVEQGASTHPVLVNKVKARLRRLGASVD